MNYENMTRRRVLCFGDSNTHGYCADPAAMTLPATGAMATMSATRWCCRTCWATAGA